GLLCARYNFSNLAVLKYPRALSLTFGRTWHRDRWLGFRLRANFDGLLLRLLMPSQYATDSRHGNGGQVVHADGRRGNIGKLGPHGPDGLLNDWPQRRIIYPLPPVNGSPRHCRLRRKAAQGHSEATIDRRSTVADVKRWP